jgi:hypothetical protein
MVFNKPHEAFGAHDRHAGARITGNECWVPVLRVAAGNESQQSTT